jgi:hypothetical protein
LSEPEKILGMADGWPLGASISGGIPAFCFVYYHLIDYLSVLAQARVLDMK